MNDTTTIHGEVETKPCVCGKRMIKRLTGIATASIPPLYGQQWWCGGCGNTEPAQPIKGLSQDDIDLKNWQRAQKQPLPSN